MGCKVGFDISIGGYRGEQPVSQCVRDGGVERGVRLGGVLQDPQAVPRQVFLEYRRCAANSYQWGSGWATPEAVKFPAKGPGSREVQGNPKRYVVIRRHVRD